MGWLVALVLGLPLLCCSMEVFSLSFLKTYVVSQKVMNSVVIFLLFCAAGISVGLWVSVMASGETFAYQGCVWWDLRFLQVYWSLFVDGLTAFFFVISTSLTALVTLYAQGSYSDQESHSRLIIYLCLGLFLTVMVVASAQLLQVYIFWCLLGLIVYLLVDFREGGAQQSKSSLCVFVVNRLADVCFLCALWGCFVLFKDFDIETLTNLLPHYADQSFFILDTEVTTFSFIGVCLGLACLIKASQIGFHLGLYQATQAPVAACALIFTLFTVGVSLYLVCRLGFLFEQVPGIRSLFIGIGLFTAVFMALAASVQQNIKHIVACGAASQIGFIYVALGLSGYVCALFLGVVYMIVQALLFLGVGSVMRALSEETDIRHMGGIKGHVPVSYLFMGIGCVSLVGIPFFAGYFSKLAFFELAFGASTTAGILSMGFGGVAMVLTAYFVLRLMWGVFHGPIRAHEKVMAHIEESPPLMLIAMGFLSVGSIVGGYMGWGLFMDTPYIFLGKSCPVAHQEMAFAIANSFSFGSSWVVWGLCFLIFGFSWFYGLRLYGKVAFLSRKVSALAPELYAFIKELAYAQRVSQTVVAMPLWQLSSWLQVKESCFSKKGVYFASVPRQVGWASLKIVRLTSHMSDKGGKICLWGGISLAGIFLALCFLRTHLS